MTQKTKGRLQGAFAMLALAVLVGSTMIIETGPPNIDEFLLATGEAVTCSDSLAGWVGVDAVVVENLGVAVAELGLWTESGWREIAIEGSRSFSIAVRLERNRDVINAATKPDTLIQAVTGSFRVYPQGT